MHKGILSPLNTAETLSNNLFILLLKTMHTDLRTLKVNNVQHTIDHKLTVHVTVVDQQKIN